MHRSKALRGAVVAVLCALGTAAALVGHAGAASSSPAAAGQEVAGSVEARLIVTHFTAVGKRIVGHGVAKSTQRNAAGAVVTTAQKPFAVALQTQAGPGPCQILHLELDELDLTLLGLRVFLRSATPGEPIMLTLSADSTHGILGKLFCSLTNSTITTPAVAKTAAKALNKRVKSATVMQARATLFQPAQASNSHAGKSRSGSRALQAAQANCPVLHLILGPLHLDLLGLIVDLNKIALDIEAIPGTLLGNIFCGLTGPPAPTPPPPPPPGP